MFTWLNKQCIQSDKGYTVESTGRFSYRYSEPLKHVDISVEDSVKGGKFFVSVYDDEFYKWNDGRKIAEEKKQEILQNFIDAMAFHNRGVQVIPGGPIEYDFSSFT